MLIEARKNEAGHDVLLMGMQGQPRVQLAEQLEPLDLLRKLKQLFPALYQQVGLEIIVPQNGSVNRIVTDAHH